MTETLFDLSYETARLLEGEFKEGLATGGSTTTLVDTVDRTEADDHFNGGSVWVLRDAGGAGAAPEREYAQVTDFVQSTATATLRTALTAGIAAGDRYAIANARYPLNTLIAKLNQALKGMGPIEFSDTSVSTVASETEYTLPIAANLNLREVWEQRNAGVNDNQWIRRYDWYPQRMGTGVADKLVFETPPFGDKLLKLVFFDYHPELFVSSDKLREGIHSERVVLRAAMEAVMGRSQNPGDNDPRLEGTLRRLTELLAVAESRFMVRPVPRQTKMLAFGRADVRRYPGDQTPR
ncbi:MAG: hypothetical protein ACRDHG_13640 [Anaerolineales bacterium]